MRAKNTVVINGRVYDAVSGISGLKTRTMGMDVFAPKPRANGFISDVTYVKPPVASSNHLVTPNDIKAVSNLNIQSVKPVRNIVVPVIVHKKVQKSQTLHRGFIQKPVAYVQPENKSNRSPLISKFGAQAKPVTIAASSVSGQVKTVAKTSVDVQASISKPDFSKPEAKPTGSKLKEQLIKQQMDKIDTTPKRKHNSKRPRTLSLATMSFAILLVAGYLTYINMPNLSVRVASTRAGVDANFPEYRPDGYRFDGPVAYTPGEVSIKFASNSSDNSYLIKQRSSNWDSQAVLDNYVNLKSKSYLTYNEQGLTIYTFENKAAWVNGGVLYTIDGDAPLSSDQVLRIAGSL